jgi:titin
LALTATSASAVGSFSGIDAPMAVPPGAPTGLVAIGTDHRIDLNWTAPASPGDSAITSYLISRGTTSGLEVFFATTNSTTFDFIDVAVTNGVTYYYVVQAENLAGPGPGSNEAFATPATVPLPPLNLAAYGSAGLISLSWDPPANDGGSPVLIYQLFRATSSGAEAFLANVAGNTYPDTAVVNGTTYFYTVRAVNAFGSGVMSDEVSATPGLPPTEPTSLTLTPGDGMITLTWISPAGPLVPASDGGVTITSFRIYRGDASGAESFLTSVPGIATTFIDAGLSNGVVYYYIVTAVNDIGESPPSLEAFASPGSIPTEPLNLAAVGSLSQIYLVWDPPASDGGSPIINYNIFRSLDDIAYAPLDISGVNEYIDAAVTNGVTYFYRVTAENTFGVSSPSASVSAVPGDLPGAPRDLAVASGNGFNQLSWLAPLSNGGSAIISYAIYRGESSGGESLLTVVGNVLSFTDTAVVDGVQYFYMIAARNAVGEGPLSLEMSGTPSGLPTAPQNLSATGSLGEIYLLWDLPVSDGGSPITGYEIFRGLISDSLSLLDTTNANDYLDLAVINGVTYFYKVRAFNANGAGDLSGEVSAIPGGVPSAPRNLAASRGDGSIVLTWLAPSSNGGSAITNYAIYRGDVSGGEALLTVLGDVLTFTDTGVSNGVQYFYTVAARNDVGEGPMSAEASAIPGTVPSSPLNLSATGSENQIALLWDPPASDGGWPVISYRVFRAAGSGGFSMIATVIAPTTTYVDEAVVDGILYHYMVSAVNINGEGPQCAQIDAMAGSLPSAPEDVEAAAGDSEVELEWSPPEENGGAPIIAYLIFRSEASNDPVYLTSVPGDVLEFEDTGLTNGVVYYYFVAAQNAVGIGPYSEEVAALPVGPPSVPLDLAGMGDENEISLSWSAPVSNGGSTILHYNIYRASSPFQLIATVPGTVTSYVDESVQNGHLYEYKVTAVNDYGESGSSASIFVMAGEIPDAPTGLTAEAGIGQITLTWHAPASNGGCPITAYLIFRDTGSGSEVFLISVPGDQLSYVDIPVDAGVAYFYMVAAQNAVGISAMSNEATAIAANLPSVPLDPVAVGDNDRISLTWTAPASDGGRPLLYYHIYRSASAFGPFEKIGTVLAAELSFIDTTARNGDLYFYQISAENEFGEGGVSDIVFAIAGGVPTEPKNLTASSGEVGRVTLNWEAPDDDGGVPIYAYIIYRDTVSGSLVFLISVPGSERSYTDIPVDDGVVYYYTVQAVNEAGQGPISNEAVGKPVGFPTVPLNVVAVGNNNQVSIFWDPPVWDGGSALIYYNIYRLFIAYGNASNGGNISPRRSPTSDISNDSGYVKIGTVVATGTTFIDYGVLNGDIVKYKVTAENQYHESGLSDSALVVVGGPPTEPQNLIAMAGNSQITLAWDAPADDGGYPIDAYIIYRDTISNSHVFLISVGPNERTYTDIPVENGVAYYYTIQAQNRVSVGLMSREVACVAGSTPTVPTNVSIGSTIGVIGLNWTIPIWDGGRPLEGFNIYRSTVSADGPFELIATAGPSSISFADSNVTNGMRYFYAVTAFNQIGESGMSVVVTEMAGDVPSVPLNFRLAFGDTIAILTWGAPDSDGGTSIVNYVISRGTESMCWEFLVAVPGDARQFIDSSVCPGETYYYVIRATNAYGTGPNSTEEVLIIATLPSSPLVWDSSSTDLDDFAKGSMGQISLKWCEPEFDGGDVVLYYLVYRGDQNSTSYLTSVQAPVHSYVDLDVTNGMRYFYQVTAVNKIGEGPKSPSISAIPGSLPSKPTALVLTAGDNQVLVNWSAPSFLGGCPVLQYLVYRGDSSGAECVLAVVPGTMTSYLDATVSNGKVYYYAIAAQNAVGNSEQSAETYSLPGSFPSAPTHLYASRGTDQIALTWWAPEVRASSPVLSYQIFRGGSPNTLMLLATIPFAPLSYVDTSVQSGLNYYYAISATNEFGAGPLSMVKQAISGSLPSSPQNLVTESSATSIHLRWSAPSVTGGNPVVSYTIYRGTEQGRENFVVGITSATDFVDANVTSGVTYYYRVSATTTIGEGPLSNMATGHTSSGGSGGQAVATADAATVSLLLIALAVIIVVGFLLIRKRKA